MGVGCQVDSTSVAQVDEQDTADARDEVASAGSRDIVGCLRQISAASTPGRGACAAHREVSRLLDAGILSERQVGRTRLLRANDSSPLVKPLREIPMVVTGPVVVLAEELARLDRIESACLYGSFAARMLGDAGPASHDIDVMVLGEPDVDAVCQACNRAEAAVHRPVNPTILTPEEFGERSAFLDNVHSGPAAAVIGELPWR